jgi:hypothetical protein
LFDCFSIGRDNNNNNNSSFSFATRWDNEEDDEYNEEPQPDMPQHQQLRLGFEDPSDLLQPDETSLTKNPNNLSDTNSLNRENPDDSMNGMPCLANRVKIPFISQISNFIAKMKRECSEIKNYKAYLESETKRAELQKKRR